MQPAPLSTKELVPNVDVLDFRNHATHLPDFQSELDRQLFEACKGLERSSGKLNRFEALDFLL